MDKPKRKHQPKPKPSGLVAALAVPEVEFLSPLPLDECVRRLKIKNRSVRKSPTRFEAYLRQISADQFAFQLRREIDEQNYRGRKYNTRVRVSGTLSYWDDEATLVTCKASMGIHVGYIVLVLVGLFFIGTVLSLVEKRSLELFMIVLFGLPLVGIASFFAWFNVAHEHRKLMALVEDMLRAPIQVTS